MTIGLFELGTIVQTDSVDAWEAEQPERRRQLVVGAVGQHALSNWGDADDELSSLNEQSLETGYGQLHSVWLLDDEELWVITDLDAARTTVLFPEDY